MKQVAVLVVLSHYPDLFAGFKSDVDIYEPNIAKLLIRDGDLIPIPDGKWTTIAGKQPFNFCRNMNLAWDIASTHDVVIAGDDVRFSHPFVSKLQEIAYSDPKIGFCVPETGGQSAFVCAYIKRAVIEATGPMDEKFDSYGYGDNDYYRRFEALGWRTQPTTEVKIIHQGATSFYRKAAEGGEEVQISCDRGRKIYEEKWGE